MTRRERAKRLRRRLSPWEQFSTCVIFSGALVGATFLPWPAVAGPLAWAMILLVRERVRRGLGDARAADRDRLDKARRGYSLRWKREMERRHGWPTYTDRL